MRRQKKVTKEALSLSQKIARRVALFKRFGFDVVKSRETILGKVGDLSGRLLEIGTGNGFLTTALVRRGLTLVSVDLDSSARRIARAQLSEVRGGGHATLRAMDAERLKFRKGAFGCVLSVDFFHHARRPQRCLKEMMRVAARKLVLADLNTWGYRVMDQVHAFEGKVHPMTKLPMEKVCRLLKKNHWKVKTYKTVCHEIVVAEKE